jgi:hypothetical protein
MDRQEILDLYDWEPGVCFRHPGRGELPTAHVKTIRPAAGGIQDVRACKDCVVAMEEERARLAACTGQPYEAGRLHDSHGGE